MTNPRKKLKIKAIILYTHMIILGIDPGTAITGYGFINTDKHALKVIEYGCVFTPAKTENAKRIAAITEQLTSLIQKHCPNYIAIEQLFFFKNVKTAISVSEARGAILLIANQLRIDIHEYTPLQVKQAITGYGKAEKTQIQKMVKVILQLKEIPKPDDAADALAVAICCANRIHANF